MRALLARCAVFCVTPFKRLRNQSTQLKDKRLPYFGDLLWMSSTHEYVCRGLSPRSECRLLISEAGNLVEALVVALMCARLVRWWSSFGNFQILPEYYESFCHFLKHFIVIFEEKTWTPHFPNFICRLSHLVPCPPLDFTYVLWTAQLKRILESAVSVHDCWTTRLSLLLRVPRELRIKIWRAWAWRCIALRLN